MEEENNTRLIVGLGNPGSAYEFTRHNIGFLVVKRLAEKYSVPFRSSSSLSGQVAETKVGEKKVILLLPSTYMNRCGHAVKLCADYFKLPSDKVLTISDDVYLSFGKCRVRDSGSAGGHNGLKSIVEQLKTQYFSRLRIGIGGEDFPERAEYVLGKFDKEETSLLPGIIDEAVSVAEDWIALGIQGAIKNLARKIEANEKD